MITSKHGVRGQAHTVAVSLEALPEEDEGLDVAASAYDKDGDLREGGGGMTVTST